MKRLLILFIIALTYSCATITDSVVTSISDEEYNSVREILLDLEDYRVTFNSDSLDRAYKKAESIDLESIYNSDYKGKVLGLLAILNYYKGNIHKSKSYISDLEIVNKDEELLWIAKYLNTKDSPLGTLIEAKENLYETETIDFYLADAYLKEGSYGEAAALYDTILLKDLKHWDYYKSQRDLAYNFFKNPPSNFETGAIYIKDQISYKDLVKALEYETTYLDNFNSEEIFIDLLLKEYFFLETSDNDLVLRKDLSYFLFKLYSNRKTSLGLLDKHNDFYIPEPTNEEISNLDGLSPISDVPSYVYYFYPSVFLVEEGIMELPDGEKFYPLNNLSGEDIQRIISNLKKRLN